MDNACGIGMNAGMLIRVSHLTTYRYASPAMSVIQMLRLTPPNHDGQYVCHWRIDVSADCRLDQHEDAFGNITHSFTAEGPFEQLKVLAEGEVETRDTQGIVRGTAERFPPSLFLRETNFTCADPAIADFAIAARAAAGAGTLAQLHQLLNRLHREITLDADPAQPAATAIESFATRRGASGDLTHIFIAAARSLGVPARFVSGYVQRQNGLPVPDGSHAWAESFVDGLGWVAFDVANGLCPTEAHVRVAVGLDHLGAAAARGTRYGGSEETSAAKVQVEQATLQGQN